MPRTTRAGRSHGSRHSPKPHDFSELDAWDIKVVVLSHDAVGTGSSLFETLCLMGMPVLHANHSCLQCSGGHGRLERFTPDVACSPMSSRQHADYGSQTANLPPAHVELRALHSLAKSCAQSGVAVDADCDPRLWVSRVTYNMQLLAGGPSVALAGSPYAHMMRAYRGAEWCGASFIIQKRDPSSWAASYLQHHGNEPMCALAALVADPFDILLCAEQCVARSPSASLHECFTTPRALGLEQLRHAFARAQASLLTIVGPRALVFDDANSAGPLRGRLTDFLHARHTHAASRVRGDMQTYAACAAAYTSTPPPATPTALSTSWGVGAWGGSSEVFGDRSRGNGATPPNEAAVPFFMHEFDELSTVTTFFKKVASSGLDLDASLPVSDAMYLTDVFLYDAWRAHRGRVHDASRAVLHVLAIPAHASLVRAVATLGDKGNAVHLSRMRAVAARLQKLRAVTKRLLPKMAAPCPTLLLQVTKLPPP